MTGGPVDEQLSAWLDDELPPAEAELLARRLVQDQERRAQLARFGLIGEALRSGHAPARGALSLSQRVAVALDAADDPPEIQVRQGAGWGARRLAAVAAAAVVAVVLLTAQRGQVTVPAIQSAGIAPAVNPVATTGIETPAEASLSPRRLTGYLVRHGEYSGFLSAKLTDSHIVNNRAYSRLASMSETAPR